MTSAAPAASAGDRWLRAIGYGLLAEIATILTIIGAVVVHRYVFKPGLSDAEYASFGAQAGAVLGVLAGTIFVYLFANLLMPRLAANHVAHGMVVAIGAIALSIGGSLAGHHGVPRAYILASLLKLAAGAFAGFRASPRRTAAV
jgi:hypothetical protein